MKYPTCLKFLVSGLLGVWPILIVVAADDPSVTRPEDETVLRTPPETLSKVDRRPGILEEPSDIPTGDQAYLYEYLEKRLSDDSL